MAKTSVEDYVIDFSKEESSGGQRFKAGIYKVKVLVAKPTTSSEKGTEGLLVTFVFMGGKYNKKKINDTLWATTKAYSRFRSLLEACDKPVPKRIALSKIAAAVKGATLYIDVQDEPPREGYSVRSRVTFDGFISEEDYESDDDEADEDEDEEDDEDDEDEEEDDEEDDEDEDEEEDDEDDEDEEEEEEPAPRRRRKPAATKKAPPVKRTTTRTATKKKAAPTKKRRAKDDDDEDLDELDLEDL